MNEALEKEMELDDNHTWNKIALLFWLGISSVSWVLSASWGTIINIVIQIDWAMFLIWFPIVASLYVLIKVARAFPRDSD